MSAQTLELQMKIAAWRVKAAEGTLTREEMKEGIAYLREGRVAAGQASRATHAKRKKAFVDIPAAEDMLKELEGL